MSVDEPHALGPFGLAYFEALLRAADGRSSRAPSAEMVFPHIQRAQIMNASHTLTAIPIPGLTPDTLGNYLASLGLLRIISRKWPTARCCWRDGVFTLLGSFTFDEVTAFIRTIAEEDAWTPYSKVWDAQQKKDTKLAQAKKPIANVAAWRAQEASEADAFLSQSHLIPGSRLSFNPMFGTGGNSGKRLFSSGWGAAKKGSQNSASWHHTRNGERRPRRTAVGSTMCLP